MIREYIIKISDEIMEEEIADSPPKLVRCRDCKHWTTESELFGKCDLWHLCGVYGADWFCADGERRTE